MQVGREANNLYGKQKRNVLNQKIGDKNLGLSALALNERQKKHS